MNPMTNVKNVLKLSERELHNNSKSSWHDQYKDSAWLFIGGLPYDLTEGDIICVFSQYGEVVNINLVRDKATGKSKGYAFLCYEDQRSTILAVDNLNSIKILGRTVRVDHCEQYKAPSGDLSKVDDETRAVYLQGCAPLANTSAPLANTSAPLANTSAPLANTSAPLANTSAPLANTSAPATQTDTLPPTPTPIKQEPIEKQKKTKRKKEKKSKKKKKKRDRSCSSDSVSS